MSVITLRAKFFRCAKAVALPVLAALALLVGLAVPAAAAARRRRSGIRRCPSSSAPERPGDPLAIANASLEATAQATQITMDLGRNFLSSLGLGGRPGRRCAGPGPRPRRPSST